MPKEPPAEKRQDVPAWFMTYSDVITLLMTFFILLLTFSTNEPEAFEKVQVSMFGGSGATGLIGKRPDGLERDSFLARVRPAIGRMTIRGSEMPPIDEDPTLKTLGTGLEGMEQQRQSDPTVARSIQVPMAMLVADDEVTPVGEQHLKMLARQLHAMTLHVSLQVGQEAQLPAMMAIAQYLVRHGGVPGGKIATGLADVKPDCLRIVMTRYLDE